jgi:hypothetical protein
VVFGPSEAAQFTGDYTETTTPPWYIASIIGGPGTAPDRGIIVGASGAPVPFFTILPTQSVILYQYVTDLEGYATGLAVANTASDVYNTAGQTGTITFYLFQTGVTTPIVYTVVPGNGRGLNATGTLSPGNVFAISLDELLGDAGQSALVGNFSGYVMALCEFNYGHGFDIVFNQNGVGTALNALYLGSGARVDVPGVGLGQ